MLSIAKKLGIRSVDAKLEEEINAFKKLGPLTQAALAQSAVKYSAAEILHIAHCNGMKDPAFIYNDEAIAAVVAGCDKIMVAEALRGSG